MNTSISLIAPQSYASNNFKGLKFKKPSMKKISDFLVKVAEPKAPLIDGMSEIESKYYQRLVSLDNKLDKIKKFFIERFMNEG